MHRVKRIAGLTLLAIGLAANLVQATTAICSNGAESPYSDLRSQLSYSQKCYFTYSGNSYFAFVYDYSQGLQESVTSGFIGYNTSLSFTAQTPDTSMTTHVGYVYNTSVGRYTQAMAVLHQEL